jgi:type I restriction enzyme S subunit
MSLPKYREYKDSGVEWLGRIPRHWNVCKFRHAFAESPERIDSEVVGVMLSVSGYRGIEIKEYDDENRRRLDEELVGYRIVRPGQLVVNTMWLNYAGLGVSEHEGHVSPAYRSYWIEPGFNKRFVHHMMRCKSFVQGYTKFLTGIRPNSLQMSREDLMGFQILRPPVDEQTAIATFLDRETTKIDELIAEQEKLIALLTEKRQATISQAVTKGLDPNALMKDSGIAYLGQVPAHWDVVAFRRAVRRIEQGWSPNAAAEPRSGDEWGVLKISAIKSGRFIEQENKALLDDTIPDKSIEVSSGDLLITRANTPDLVGDCCAVPHGVSSGLMLSDLIYRVSLSSSCNPQFFSYFLRSAVGRAQIKSDARGSSMTMAKISQGHILAWMVAIPPSSEQSAIVAFLHSAIAKLDILGVEAERAISLLQERRSALISAAVTGQIDVRRAVGLPASIETKAA